MSNFIVSEHRGTITASSGSGYQTLYINQVLVYQIIVTADTSTTAFDVVLENSHGDVMFKVESVTGEINEEIRIILPKNGTLKIENASVDENFTYLLTSRQA